MAILLPRTVRETAPASTMPGYLADVSVSMSAGQLKGNAILPGVATKFQNYPSSDEVERQRYFAAVSYTHLDVYKRQP